MGWVVETLDERVDTEIGALPVKLRAALARMAQLIESVGLERLREPHVKHIEGSIWELRLSGDGNIARAFYVTGTGQRVIILRVFEKKTQKTPSRELESARRRLSDLKARKQ